MSINIQTTSGLKKLSGENITKEKITTALGYTPADNTAVSAHVENTDIHTTANDKKAINDHMNEGDIHVTLNDKSKWNAKSEFSGSYNDLTDKPYLIDDGSADLSVTDESGNIIFKVGEAGAQTTELTLGSGENAVQVGEKLTELGDAIDTLDNGFSDDVSTLEKKVDDHIADDDVHITSAERTVWNNKSEFSGDYNDLNNKPIEEDNTGNFVIADDKGNKAFEISSEGITNTAKLTVGGKDIETIIEEHIDEIPAVEETDPTVPAWAKAATKPTYTYDEITGKPTFATVATSGSYNDLTDLPDLETGSSVALEEHISDKENPHEVTAAQVGAATPTDLSTAIDNAKKEMGEELVSEASEWHIVDGSGNIVATIDADGVHTTNLAVNGKTLEISDDGNGSAKIEANAGLTLSAGNQFVVNGSGNVELLISQEDDTGSIRGYYSPSSGDSNIYITGAGQDYCPSISLNSNIDDSSSKSKISMYAGGGIDIQTEFGDLTLGSLEGGVNITTSSSSTSRIGNSNAYVDLIKDNGLNLFGLDCVNIDSAGGANISYYQDESYIYVGQPGISIDTTRSQDSGDISISAGGTTSITSANGGVSLTNDANGSYITVGNSDITIDASANDQVVNIRGSSVNITTDTQGGNVTIQGDLTVSGTINGSTSSGITGTVQIEQGGTGATTATNARANLGIETCSDTIGSDYNVPNLGNNPQPIWIKNGVPTAMTGDVGGLYSPVCMIGGKIVECSEALRVWTQVNFNGMDTGEWKTATVSAASSARGNLVFLGCEGYGSTAKMYLTSSIVPVAAISTDENNPTWIWMTRDGASLKLKIYKDSDVNASEFTFHVAKAEACYYINYLDCYYTK